MAPQEDDITMYICKACNCVTPRGQKQLRHVTYRQAPRTTVVRLDNGAVVTRLAGGTRHEVAHEMPVCPRCHAFLAAEAEVAHIARSVRSALGGEDNRQRSADGTDGAPRDNGAP